MGDRAHVYVHEGDRPGVWIYTHWPPVPHHGTGGRHRACSPWSP
jgi:hypothetical protein